jgi:hypothetical protein
MFGRVVGECGLREELHKMSVAAVVFTAVCKRRTAIAQNISWRIMKPVCYARTRDGVNSSICTSGWLH